MEESYTKLVDKHYSPLVIRKFTHFGFPVYVGIITDDDLSSLDSIVMDFMRREKKEGWVNNLQRIRNLAGALTEHLVNSYEKSEGVAVVFSIDKAFVSSLHGDFMTHGMCRDEFYFLLNMSTGV